MFFNSIVISGLSIVKSIMKDYTDYIELSCDIKSHLNSVDQKIIKQLVKYQSKKYSVTPFVNDSEEILKYLYFHLKKGIPIDISAELAKIDLRESIKEQIHKKECGL